MLEEDSVAAKERGLPEERAAEQDWSALLPADTPEDIPQELPPPKSGKWTVVMTQLVCSVLTVAVSLVLPVFAPQAAASLRESFYHAYRQEWSIRALYHQIASYFTESGESPKDNAVLTMARVSDTGCVNMEKLSDTVVYYGSLAMRFPAEGRLSSGFGGRTSPIDGDGEYHKGLDIAAPAGTPIAAAASGTVTTARWSDSFGYFVVIDHGNGVITRYGHCEKLLVSAGDRVVMGERIALVGSTGEATGPHLHFEIRQDNVPFDPRQVFPTGGNA